ncbi:MULTISPECIES: carbohydrate-binding protein [Rhizobium]|uniref:Carbohydrate-binding protein n=1 Tax=Rhizobium sophoriradicis TaxID=1535245 RepID=A0A2A5KTU7_9HYPH|nr:MULTISPECIES: carbohydrate-binding protein [Rhizobium]ARQ61716.1 galactose-binding domain-containing protein [Rhizobium sp. Kim5]PCK80391.1 carbohydrate-binding protein [Rhizobium sophoriradicis]RSC02113.1 carbohydrate-binding protein [Rhizobium sophoriradicis]
MELTLKIVDADGFVRASATGRDETFLVYRQDYREGDCVVVEASEPGHLFLALDSAIQPGFVYIRESAYSLAVPFDDKRKSYSPNAFKGDIHRLSARKARPDELAQRRNLALNPWDDHANRALFPHARANVETRGEAVFAARNAIDGEKANDNHGFWPYTSWGINRDPEATLTVEFGRPVRIDEIVFYLRADFPHDSWWEQASVTFSNGKTRSFSLTKTGAAQCFSIEPYIVEWVELHGLVKAEDGSPFPALTQIEIWGAEALGAAAVAAEDQTGHAALSVPL